MFFFLSGLKLLNDSLELFDLVVNLVDDSVLDLVSVFFSSKFIIKLCLLLESFFQELLAKSYDALSHLLKKYLNVLFFLDL